MKLLEVVTPLSIYYGYSTRKMFWEKIFTPVSMKNCGRCNVRKHRDIKNGENYITLDINLNFFSLDKMKITSSEPNDYLGKSAKELITSLGLKIICNVSLKDISKIVKEFDNLPYEGCVRKSSKHMPTESCIYLARQIVKRMMILNMPVGPVRTQITDTQEINNSEMSAQNIPNFHVCSLD